MVDVYIICSDEDSENKETLKELLRSDGYDIYQESEVLAGQNKQDDTYKKTLNAIGEARCVLVLWADISAKEDWIRVQSNQAYESKKLIPLHYNKDLCLPSELSNQIEIKFYDWDGDKNHVEYKRLINAIDCHLPKPKPKPKPEPEPEEKIIAIAIVKAIKSMEKEEEKIHIIISLSILFFVAIIVYPLL